MRKNTQSSADDGDAAEESFDGGRIEAMASSGSGKAARLGAERSATAPGWTKRLSTRGKLARALITALAVLVALIVLLPHPAFTLPPEIARLLTPAPTATPQPGHFGAGQWEQIAGPPVQTAGYYDLLASSVDPLTAFTCTLPVPSDPSSPSSVRPIIVWVTHDAGVRWAQASLPLITGTSCEVSPARDGSQSVTLSVSDDALDRNAQTCAHSQYFLSEDDGATWRRIQYTSIAPPVSQSGVCTLWAAGRHLYLATSVYNNGDQGRAFLERSDDGGLTWTRADHGLAEVQASWYAQPLDGVGDTLAAVVVGGTDVWITQDSGASWRRTGAIAGGTLGTGTAGYLVTEASLGGGPKACHCLFAFSFTRTGGASMGQLSTSHDATHWSPLPPIPVRGTTAARSGVYDILGTTVDGKLLVLGAEPSVGAVATLDASGRLIGPPPRLWAWDSWTGRWELAESRVPCQDLQTCTLYATGAAAVFGADDAPQGTQFWLTGAVRGEGSQPMQTFYRLFLPAD